MDQHLYKYLVLHKHLAIPQLGSFVIGHVPAHYDESLERLYAPKPVLTFTEGAVPMSEKRFFDFLATELDVDEVTAIQLYHDFVHTFRNELLEKGVAELKGVGTLTRIVEGKISFQPAHDPSDLLPPVKQGAALPASIETYEETETAETKDPWWMYAIILVIMGLGALIFYYS